MVGTAVSSSDPIATSGQLQTASGNGLPQQEDGAAAAASNGAAASTSDSSISPSKDIPPSTSAKAIAGPVASSSSSQATPDEQATPRGRHPGFIGIIDSDDGKRTLLAAGDEGRSTIGSEAGAGEQAKAGEHVEGVQGLTGGHSTAGSVISSGHRLKASETDHTGPVPAPQQSLSAGSTDDKVANGPLAAPNAAATAGASAPAVPTPVAAVGTSQDADRSLSANAQQSETTSGATTTHQGPSLSVAPTDHTASQPEGQVVTA